MKNITALIIAFAYCSNSILASEDRGPQTDHPASLTAKRTEPAHAPTHKFGSETSITAGGPPPPPPNTPNFPAAQDNQSPSSSGDAFLTLPGLARHDDLEKFSGTEKRQCSIQERGQRSETEDSKSY